MSRIAKKPISIPKGVETKLESQRLIIKGPKGQLEYTVHDLLSLTIAEGVITVVSKQAGKADQLKSKEKALIETLAGTTRANINNMVKGVSEGFERKLLLVGVGYRTQMQGKNLNLSLGFSHPVNFVIPVGIQIETPSQTEIIIKGADKHLVGQVAANIRAIRPVEPYKGKGVRYSDERVILKETKKQ